MDLASIPPNPTGDVEIELELDLDVDRETRLERRRRAQEAETQPSIAQQNIVQSAIAADRRALAATLGRALASVTVRLDPYREANGAMAYVAAVRLDDASLPHAAALLRAAEKLGIGRHVRERLRSCIADRIASEPSGASVVVVLTADDIDDAAMYDPDSMLSRVASRVVLRIPDLASVPHAEASLAALCGLGFRLHGDEQRTTHRNAA